jgi:hypothetical protein
MAYQAPSIPAPGRISRTPRGPLGLSDVQRREIKRFFEALFYLSTVLSSFAELVFIPLARFIHLISSLIDPIRKPTLSKEKEP